MKQYSTPFFEVVEMASEVIMTSGIWSSGGDDGRADIWVGTNGSSLI